MMMMMMMMTTATTMLRVASLAAVMRCVLLQQAVPRAGDVTVRVPCSCVAKLRTSLHRVLV
jgi:hypothetical protein